MAKQNNVSLNQKMINKKQYNRLTIAFALPLLALGWWLAENESIFPLHRFIICEEYNAGISCRSRFTTKSEATSNRFQGGVVTLRGARLIRGFNHPVVSLSDMKYFKGKFIYTPPDVEPDHLNPPLNAEGTLQTLSLPPKFPAYDPLSYCSISKHRDGNGRWTYWCSGRATGFHNSGVFKFQDELTRQKFEIAEKSIQIKYLKNKDIQNVAYIASVLVPSILYFLFSLSAFYLIRVTKWVIHGNKGDAT